MSEPSWMAAARSLMGTLETPGPASNPKIVGWAKRLGGWIANFYKSDDIPWCGLFVAHCLTVNGYRAPENPLSALAYDSWGEKLSEPTVGAIMVFVRKGGGHVGFYVGEDETAFHILGGNQSDSVSITRVGKDRFRSARWPSEAPAPEIRRVLAGSGGSLSRNEA